MTNGKKHRLAAECFTNEGECREQLFSRTKLYTDIKWYRSWVPLSLGHTQPS
jgi:hypothetical protein